MAYLVLPVPLFTIKCKLKRIDWKRELDFLLSITCNLVFCKEGFPLTPGAQDRLDFPIMALHVYSY